MSKKKVIPFSNYIKLSLIVVLTIIGAFICRNLYVSNINYQKSISIIRDVLVSEINSSEVYNYIRENDNAVLYIGVVYDDSCRSLEKELKAVITEQKLENTITYLNITDNKKKSSFIKEFNKFYGIKLLGYPSFVYFEDGKVKDLITVKTGNNLKISEIEDFINRNNLKDLYD